MCHFVLVFFSPFGVAIASLGGGGAGGGGGVLVLVLFVRLFGLCLFRFVGFLFLLGSGKGCGLLLWHSLDFSLNFFSCQYISHIYIFFFPVLAISADPCAYIIVLKFERPFYDLLVCLKWLYESQTV